MKRSIKKFAVLALIFAMIFNMTFVNAQTVNNEGLSQEEFIARYGDTIDLTGQLEKIAGNEDYLKQIEESVAAFEATLTADEEPAEEGDVVEDPFTEAYATQPWPASDDNNIYFKNYTLRSIGDTVEIWVANDLSFDDDRDAHVVTQAQVDQIRDYFDEIIYPTDTAFFGAPDSHDGTNNLAGPPGFFAPYEEEKIVILVDNVRDENFYDADYPFYVAGFYWGLIEQYTDRNVITIDSSNWDTRLDSTYRGTVAHELQHLIHSDNDAAEETFLNEGMSDFAEYLCFGTHSMGHVNYFLDHPENSLVTWDEYTGDNPETLADYGQAYLLQLYLYEKYGREFTKELATNGEYQGIESIDYMLNEFGAGINFEELFRRFSVAVAVDDAKAIAINEEIEEGAYAFDTIDLKINFEAAAENAKDGVPAWGADYKVLVNENPIKTVLFDGIDVLLNPTPWVVNVDPLDENNTVLWGNEGDELANQLIFSADLTGLTEATLQFDNFIQIEQEWDFGFVEVSTDNGVTWTPLANDNTHNHVVPNGYPAIQDKLVTGEGFSGYYDEWTPESFDLSAYAGQEIYINFNYMTDWGYNDAGWFIDNIAIPEIGYMNTCDTLEEFMGLDELLRPEVFYGVTFINEQEVGKKGKILRRVLNLDLFNVSDSDSDSTELNNFFNSGTTYMVVWYAADPGRTGVVDFSYELVEKELGNPKAKVQVKENPNKGKKK